jgi:hypothetical protein
MAKAKILDRVAVNFLQLLHNGPVLDLLELIGSPLGTSFKLITVKMKKH